MRLRRIPVLLLLAGLALHAAPWSGRSYPFRIAVFGDSTSAPRKGVDTYREQLTRQLAGSRPPIIFFNAAVPGDSSEMARRRFDRDILTFRPDLLIIQLGINDAAIDVWKKPPASGPRVSVARYEENLRYFITTIRRQGGQTLLLTPNQLRWTDKLRQMYGHPPYVVADERGFTRPVEPYVAVVRRLAQEYDLPLVDVYQMYDDWERKHRQSCSGLLLDGMHPNTQGQALVADALWPFILEARRLPAGGNR